VDNRVRKIVVVDHLVHKYDEFYAPFITEATLQVTMALRSESGMVGRRQKYRGSVLVA